MRKTERMIGSAPDGDGFRGVVDGIRCCPFSHTIRDAAEKCAERLANLLDKEREAWRKALLLVIGDAEIAQEAIGKLVSDLYAVQGRHKLSQKEIIVRKIKGRIEGLDPDLDFHSKEDAQTMFVQKLLLQELLQEIEGDRDQVDHQETQALEDQSHEFRDEGPEDEGDK